MAESHTAAATVASARMGLAFQQLKVDVHSSVPSHLEWLAEFLVPHFERADHGPFDSSVRFTADPALFETLVNGGPAADGALRDCFALDSSVIRLPVWNGPSTKTTVFDEPFSAFYSTALDGKPEISIVTADTDPGPRVPLMRIVRELAMNHAHAVGGLFLHASACGIGGRGVIITGPKASGKTTLALHFLRRGAAFLANDRVLVSFDAPMTLRGMPTIVTIRRPTLDRFPDLAERLLASNYHARLSLEETRQPGARPISFWNDGRCGLSPAQFCAMVGTAPVAQASPAAVLFPTITGDAGGLQLHALGSDDAAERLKDSLFGHSTWKKRGELFVSGGQALPSEDELIRRCGRLARQIPCFECRLGLDAYDDPRSPLELLDEMVHP